ncbi:MAG: YjjG family noncanonical pyrimidine nucleotidase [Ilumatobacter sp.]
MTSRYTTIFFDLDHTLLDSHASEQAAFAQTMQSIGVVASPSTFETYDRINQGLWRRVEAGELSPNDVKVLRFERMLTELGVDGDPVAMGATFVQGLAGNGELYRGALDVLDAVRAVARLAMITNGIGWVQRGRIERLGLGDYFEQISISGELGMSKPRRDIFDHTLTEMQLTDRSRVLMVGDNLGSDIAGAHNAGIDSAWFNPNGSVAGDVVPTHTVSSLADLTLLI